jgi:hypothetical protein
MSKIDWTKPIEAFDEDGNVVQMRLDDRFNQPDSAGDYRTTEAPHGSANEWWFGNGKSRCCDNWRIRNRQPTPSTDRLARLEAFVARVASDEPGGRNRYRNEAKALVDELNPVDPLLIKARRIALGEWQPTAWGNDAWESRVMAGDEDEDRAVRSAYSALRQARKEGNDNAK